MSSRKSVSAWTTTISLYKKTEAYSVYICYEENNSRMYILQKSGSSYLRGVLRGLLWRSRILRARSMTDIIRVTLCSMRLSVCIHNHKEAPSLSVCTLDQFLVASATSTFKWTSRRNICRQGWAETGVNIRRKRSTNLTKRSATYTSQRLHKKRLSLISWPHSPPLERSSSVHFLLHRVMHAANSDTFLLQRKE
jgi:hypothetical protein